VKNYYYCCKQRRAGTTPRGNNSRRADQLVFLNLIEISMWDDLAGAVVLRQRAPIIKMKCNESHKTRIIGRRCVMYIALPNFFLLFRTPRRAAGNIILVLKVGVCKSGG
jgi:hypothetical protein